MTFTQDRNLQTGIVVSVAIHAVLLFLLALSLSIPPTADFSRKAEEIKKEPEVTLIFPDQVILQPPPPPVVLEKKPQVFIRTTQNEASPVKPKNAPFQSDRDTIAASERPPVPGALAPMPTLTGTAPDISELANRDYKDGQIKNDSAPKAAPTQISPPPIVKPQQAPRPVPPPQVAKSQPAPTPLNKMMEEMDQKTQPNKDHLPLEVRKATPDVPDMPLPTPTPPVETPMPQVRVPEDTPPEMMKPALSQDAVAHNTPKPETDAFSPFTRTSKTDGSISREGQDAVDAEGTPLGKYTRQVTGAVEKKWHLYVRLGKDSVTFGRVRFRFYVDKKGIPQDLKILSDAKDADPRMRELTLRAILDAQIPPIPPDLLPSLDDGRVKIEYEAIIY